MTLDWSLHPPLSKELAQLWATFDDTALAVIRQPSSARAWRSRSWNTKARPEQNGGNTWERRGTIPATYSGTQNGGILMSYKLYKKRLMRKKSLSPQKLASSGPVFVILGTWNLWWNVGGVRGKMAENRDRIALKPAHSWGRPKLVGSARNPTDKSAPKECLRPKRDWWFELFVMFLNKCISQLYIGRKDPKDLLLFYQH